MRIEEICVMFGLIFMSYWIGYIIGWHRCADYIMSKITEWRDINGKRDRGPDEPV